MKPIIICSCALIAAFSAFGASPVVDVSDQNPLDTTFHGFGFEWDTYGYAGAGVTSEDVALMEKRIAWMRPGIVRVAMQARWCYLGNDRYDWDTPDMRQLLRVLDVCEKLKIKVILTEWGCEPDWLKVPDLHKIDDPRYAGIIGTYVDYLINVRKYTCLKWFVLGNEPNFEVRDVERWFRGVQQVSEELRKRKLSDRVAIVGPDASGERAEILPWIVFAAKNGSSVFGGYDFHRYALLADINAGDIRNLTRSALETIRGLDSDKSKPVFITEAGFFVSDPDPAKSSSTTNNPLVDTGRFGVQMAQFATQATEGGASGVLAWMLDDTSYGGFKCGLWKSKAEGYKLRPWFSSWGLLVRAFPPGSSFRTVPPPAPLVSILAARMPSEGENWAFCVSNLGKDSASFRIRVPNGPEGHFDCYVYENGISDIDADGIPVSRRPVDSHLNEGLEITCPPDSVVYFIPRN